jgi:hypothetical protein
MLGMYDQVDRIEELQEALGREDWAEMRRACEEVIRFLDEWKLR